MFLFVCRTMDKGENMKYKQTAIAKLNHTIEVLEVMTGRAKRVQQ